MVTDVCFHFTYDSKGQGIQCMSCFSLITNEMLPDIRTMENKFSDNFILSYLFPFVDIIVKNIILLAALPWMDRTKKTKPI